jgi:FkbM family methyltransferase
MANSTWKRFEKSRPYKLAKLFFKRLAGKELWLRREVDVETVPQGDWRVCPEGLGASSVVYSLGVGDNIDFDLGLIAQWGCEVHAFDPTPFAAAWLAKKSVPSSFRFHPWAIAGSDGVLPLYPRLKKDGTFSDVMFTQVPEGAARDHRIDVPALTIDTAMRRLGHDRIDLLKVDIEGAEYEVLEALPTAAPAQLLVEFHHRFPGIGVAKTSQIIERLRSRGYRIMAVSQSGREVSFLRRVA